MHETRLRAVPRLNPETAGPFFSALGHEIRTPMTSILGYADLALEEAGAAPIAEHLRIIRRSGEMLLSLLNDVLDVAQFELGQLKVRRAPTALRPRVEEVRALMRSAAIQKGISLELEFRGSLPVTVETDSVRLRQILMQLVGNAIKFTDRGRVQLVVRLADSPRLGRPEVVFDVIDTGVGIAESRLPHLFQPFAQADGTLARRPGGAGLGLALVQRLTNLLGGEVTVRSAEGQGSCFSVSIDPGSLDGVPFRNAASLPDPARRSLASGEDQTVRSLVGLHVLIAEDIPATQKLIDYHCRRAGARTVLADNGVQALERFHEAARDRRPFDLIVLDMQMPLLDGYEVTRRLRETGCRLPIIALTAHAMEGDREKCLAAGCTEYLTKPIDHAELVDRVGRLARASAPAVAVSLRDAQPIDA